MVAYSFQPQFVPKLKSGEKSQTIRALGRRRHARPDEMVQIYTGMRTKHCQLIYQSPCISVTQIEIYPDRTVKFIYGELEKTLDDNEKQELAIADGFASVDEFMNFFASRFSHRDRAENIPFEGVLIKWQPLPF